MTLFFWNFCDLNTCEFLVGGLLIAAVIIIILRRDKALMRPLVALAVYVVVITIASPQLVKETIVADVRYIMPVIPLCIAIEVMVIKALFGNKPQRAIAVAILAFGTNVLHGGFFYRQECARLLSVISENEIPRPLAC